MLRSIVTQACIITLIMGLATSFGSCKAKDLKKLQKMGKDALSKHLKKGSKSKLKKKEAKKPPKDEEVEKPAEGKRKGGPSLVYTDDLTRAFSKAKKRKRRVLVIMSQEHCPPCQAMKQEVYKDKKVKRALANYIIATDGWTSGIKKHGDLYTGGQASELSEGGMYYTPTYGIYTADGKFVKKQVGGSPKADFLKFLK